MPTLRKIHTRLASVAPAPPIGFNVDILHTPAAKLPAFTRRPLPAPTAKQVQPKGVTSQLEEDLKPAARGPTGEFLKACPQPNVLDIVKWRFRREANQIPRDLDVLNATLPVLTPDFTAPIPDRHARITWLGHASVLLEVPLPASTDRMTFLTDAVFSDRCSPSQFFGPARYRPCPVQVETLPHVDAVLISHNHYDHMDVITLDKLHRAQPHLHWFVPLNNAAYLTAVGIPQAQIHEQNWWDMDPLTKHASTFRISCVPAKHWSKRGLNDTNKALWGGWVVQGLGGSFYFVGDTAYDSFFDAIHHRFGDQSVSAIPIGAYAPRNLFTYQHVNVDEAVQIHRDVRSRASVGIHWGTWELTDEFYLEPKQELARQMAQDPASFVALDHGAHKVVPWTL
ncbi:Aste57867_15417 [Aphanomyces stellatus]|uniref:Aste57867_15417 protein n=1 Tax=Aphanomyces stellatus TaxID=120398 RepID=A0A485L327_9STRA|nr:hypothetical protein As57867_015361 [Aphanomyces stellatus]VFT92219.1 Aste57867_15417 [Aphanomyces stellatus]